MMQRCLRLTVFVCVLSCGFLSETGPAYAQDGGTQSVFATGAGNRALAMGGAYAALSDDASAPLWNPGGLGFVQRWELQATRTSLYGLEIAEEYATFALPSWRWGVGAVSLRHFGVQGIEGRDGQNQVTSDFASDDSELLLSYAKAFKDEAWSLGGSLKLRRQSLGQVSATGVGADVGMIAKPGKLFGNADPWSEKLTLGLSIRNLVEPAIRLEEETVNDPISMRFGAAYQHRFSYGGRVVATADLERVPDRDMRFYAGLEFQVHPLVALRSGMQNGNLSAGAGVRWRDLSFDYAFGENDLGSIHRLGVSAQFGPSTSERYRLSVEREEQEIQERLSVAFAEQEDQRLKNLVQNAKDSFAAEDYEGTLQTLAVVNTLRPDHPETHALEIGCWEKQAEELEQADEFAGAVLNYQRALALDPENEKLTQAVARCREESASRAERDQKLRAAFEKGLDAFGQGNLLVARRQFREVLKQSPDDEESSAMLERTEIAIDNRIDNLSQQVRRFVAGELYTDAESSLKDLENIGASSSLVSSLKQDIRRGQRKKLREASQAKRPVETTSETETATQVATTPAPPRITEDDKKEAERLYTQGVEALKSGRTTEAVAYLELVVAKDQSHGKAAEYLKQEYLTQGMDAFASGDLDRAVGQWEKALALDPTDERARGYLARARQQISRTREILGKGK